MDEPMTIGSGIDSDNGTYGRWVAGTARNSNGTHQIGSKAFEREWAEWIDKCNSGKIEPTIQNIMGQMQQMRNSGKYPS